MSQDPRSNVYQAYQGGEMLQLVPQDRVSAAKILKILYEYVQPQSVLDVGCGLGVWLEGVRNLGVSEIKGIEGKWLDRSKLVIDPGLVDLVDLEQGFSLGRKFDLVICLEVAEHLSAAAADGFVQRLADHGDLILFSAAIPFQGGHFHINEQFPEYWAELFAKRGFYPLDFIRPRIWKDNSIACWLCQNTLVFAHERVLALNDKLRGEQRKHQVLSMVHPELFTTRIQLATRIMQENQGLVQFLGQGGTFTVKRNPDGKLNIVRS